MKKYYVLLTEIVIPLGNQYDSAYWRKNKSKKELNVTTRGEAIDEAIKIFKEHRQSLFKLIDSRFTKDHKDKLLTIFPQKMTIIDEITHEYEVPL